MSATLLNPLSGCQAACLLSLVLLGASAHAAPPEFNIYNLGLYPNNGAQMMAVNNSGQATGFSTVGLTSTKNAARLSGGVVSNLHNQGGVLLGGYSGSLGYGINDTGTVVGQALRTNITAYVPFISTNGGTMVEIPNGLGGTSGGTARDINNSGLVVGSEYGSGNTTIQAFSYDTTDGTTTALGNLGGTQSEATAVNESGQAVGWALLPNYNRRAVSFAGGVATDLGTLGGATAEASDLNDAGKVVGWATTAGGATHAFSFQNGVMADLGTFFGTGNSKATGINNAGWIVGQSYWGGPYGWDHAFLYRNGAMTDLNNFIDPALGITLVAVQGLSDTGYIVATGFNSLLQGGVYALTPVTPLPVPEPGTWALLASGLLLVGRAGRRATARQG